MTIASSDERRSDVSGSSAELRRSAGSSPPWSSSRRGRFPHQLQLPLFQLQAERKKIQSGRGSRFRKQFVALVLDMMIDGAGEIRHKLVHGCVGLAQFANLRDQQLGPLVLVFGFVDHVGRILDGLAQRWIENFLFNLGMYGQLIADFRGKRS